MSRRHYIAMRFPVHPMTPDSDTLEYPVTVTLPSITVVVTDREPVRTGLYDASGTPLYAVEERDQAAFVRFGKA